MGHDITTDPIDTDNALAVADNGDDLDADVINAVFEPMANSLRAHRAALLAHIAWSGDFAVAPLGSPTVFSISVGAIAALFAEDEDGNYRQGSAPPTTLDVLYVEGTPGTLGAVARWWYVYAFNTTTADVNGVAEIGYAISASAPDANRRHKSADPSRVYLGCFRTLASGAPLPMQKVAGRCLYRTSALGSGELQVASVSTATGQTTQSLAALAPPHARMARLALAATGDGSQAALNIFYPGDTAAKSAICYAAASSVDNEIHVDVPTDASQRIDYSVTGAGSPAASVRVLGFYE